MRQNQLKPLARLIAATAVGVDPRTMGIGPVPAMKKLQDKTGLSVEDYDLIELNEAFAAQCWRAIASCISTATNST